MIVKEGGIKLSKNIEWLKVVHSKGKGVVLCVLISLFVDFVSFLWKYSQN